MMIKFLNISLWFVFSVLAGQVYAQAQGQHQHGDYTVYHTVFNSMFLQPDIAAAYGLVRGKQWFMVNISVNGAGKMHGQPAILTGTATNLMQQQEQLQFQEISEGDATYYIAPLQLASQGVLHFDIKVKTAADKEPFLIKFTHKYAEHP